MELDRARRMRCIRVPQFHLSLFAFAAVTLTFGLPAQAQSVAELAAYSAADRTQRLVDGARKENALMIYSSMTVADMGVLINAFQAKYGVKKSSHAIENTMAQLAKGLVDAGVGRLVVAGGETSGAVVGALDVTALRIGPEIDPGVPWTASVGQKPMLLALKSGNFGAPDFFTKAFAKL